MQKYPISGLLTVLPIIYSAHSSAAPTETWQEDLRRCMVYKRIFGGRIAIAIDEGVLWIDVQPEGGDATKTVPDKYRITFDNGTPIDGTAKDAEPGIFDNKLGAYSAVAATFSKAKEMKVSISSETTPVRAITVPLGNGAKAMAFLKTCEAYWRRHNARHR
jgi:hypothetical protein